MIDSPIFYETTTDAPTLHPSAAINLINRYPELGEVQGFPDVRDRVVEMEAGPQVFLTADECDALAVRLIQHAAVLRLG